MLGDSLLAIKNKVSEYEQVDSPHSRRRRVFIMPLVLLVTVCIITTVIIVYRATPAIPTSVLNQLTFKPFVFSQNNSIKIDQSTYRYNSDEGGIVFIASASDFGKLIVSEQATPPEFLNNANAYPSLLTSMNRLSEVTSKVGVVYITRPNNQISGETAVMNASNVLVFVQSNRDLSDEQWYQVFNTFYLQPLARND